MILDPGGILEYNLGREKINYYASVLVYLHHEAKWNARLRTEQTLQETKQTRKNPRYPLMQLPYKYMTIVWIPLGVWSTK